MVIRLQRSDGIWVSVGAALEGGWCCYPLIALVILARRLPACDIVMLINFNDLLSLSTGDQEISPIHPQLNATEPDNTRTWSATSVVQVSAMRERHGDILRCVAYHENYEAKSVPVEARLDVKCKSQKQMTQTHKKYNKPVWDSSLARRSICWSLGELIAFTCIWLKVRKVKRHCKQL